MNQRYFLKLSKNKTDNFFKRHQKKIDKRKSRKVTSRNAKNQKKTWNTEGKQDDARRKEKQEIKNRGREVKKKGRLNFVVKNDFFDFFLAKQIRR